MPSPSPDETVDLTRASRLTDRSYPGSPANALGRVVSNSLDAALALGRLSNPGSDPETEDGHDGEVPGPDDGKAEDDES